VISALWSCSRRPSQRRWIGSPSRSTPKKKASQAEALLAVGLQDAAALCLSTAP
jgi:hypothetical protein